MAKIERSPENDRIIRQFLIFRGSILASFAQVEWFMAKILVEAHAFPEYAELDLDFSMRVDSRVKKLKALLNAEGPLKKYKDGILPLVDDMLSYVDTRNFMAHGVCITSASAQHGILFRLKMFKQMKGGDDHEGKIDFTIEQLDADARAISRAGVKFIRQAKTIWRDLGMDNFDVF